MNIEYTKYKMADKTPKIFGVGPGADKYVLRNSRIFSLNDIDEHIETYISDFDKFIEIAKERIAKEKKESRTYKELDRVASLNTLNIYFYIVSNINNIS